MIDSNVSLLRTKLYRPRVPVDFVLRKSLCERLEEGRNHSLTLVSAPAGYGKSTLVSQWLETCDVPHAWLSLAESESNLTTFVEYLVAAIETISPKACDTTIMMIRGEVSPAPEDVARTLCNELDCIQQRFVLVLDDYYLAAHPDVNKLLDSVLRHPPLNFHLVILTRRDPPFALAAIRARGQMTEIRMRDLVFDIEHAATFLDRASGRALEGSILESVYRSTEGWPVALRFAAIALRHRGEGQGSDINFSGNPRRTQEYLMSEVFAHLPQDIRLCLQKTSIFERFCATLCEMVCLSGADDDPAAPDGSGFLRRLEDVGLFAIGLDDHHGWFRYHHIFRGLLRRELENRMSGREIAELHRRAAVWFEEKELIEEAVHHLLSAQDPEAAGKLVARCRRVFTNNEAWLRLDSCLDLLPTGIIDQNQELLMLRAWSAHYRGNLPKMGEFLQRVEEMLDSPGLDAGLNEQLRGEVAAVLSFLSYIHCQGVSAVRQGEEAVRLLPGSLPMERAWALCLHAASLQMVGDSKNAFGIVHEALARNRIQGEAGNTRVLQTFGWLNAIEADLPALARVGDTLAKLGEERQLSESGGWGLYFRGMARYLQNHLEEAESDFTAVIADRTHPHLVQFLYGSHCRAQTLESLGRSQEARTEIESTIRVLLETCNGSSLPWAEGSLADLNLRQGRLPEAKAWEESFDPNPVAAWGPFVPELAAVKIRLAAGDLERAGELLSDLERFFEKIHNRRFLMETLALRALAHDLEGDEAEADAALGPAISMARAGGCLRVFVDLGPAIARPLNRLDVDEDGLRFVGRILTALRGKPADPRVESSSARTISSAPQPLIEPLTGRELEILALLGHRLTNREIGDQLFISHRTVKRHNQSIYEKLAVHGRRDAVAKSIGLGILQE